MRSSVKVQSRLAELINSYLICSKNRTGECQSVRGFVASIDKQDRNPYRNYAVPSGRLIPSSSDISCLSHWFLTRERQPRLEYMGEAAPYVEAALAAAGFVLEGKLPVMTVTKSELCVASPVAGIEIGAAETEAQLHDAAYAQNCAYGALETTQADVDRLMRVTTDGGQVVVARDVQTGGVVGAGLYSAPCEGITEIAAIGVLAPYRRRGIAAALTAKLAIRGLKQGIETIFLMAASEAEQRVYERTGFAVAGNILHMSLPEQIERS